MYSVLIQNQKTMESFLQYQPFFAEAINNNRIGVCKWIESGTTIETALPELGNLTDDKREWRAIIIRYIDDNCMNSFESEARNPYDFLINRNADNVIEESPIPLVRLAQMLGGVPPLEVKFKSDVIKEPYKAPRTVYIPIENLEAEQKHRAIVEKYRYNGRPPSSILIISVRNKKYQDESIGREWLIHKESESSEFWKRNGFPSVCRFMVYDFEMQGPVQKEADDFEFWYSVLLMSINEWDSSTLQAYRLYSLGVHMDCAAMLESFQTLVDQLRDTKCFLEKKIKTNIESQLCENEEIPDYKLKVTVPLKLPKSEECLPKKKSFTLLSNGAASDVAIWRKQRQIAEETLKSSVRVAQRALDKTAEKMRANCTFSESEVLPLSKYQEEDMKHENSELYNKIICTQAILPSDRISEKKDIKEAAEAVRKNLLGRVMTRPALNGIAIAIMLILLSSIPMIVFNQGNGKDNPMMVLYFCIAYICTIFVAAFSTVIFQKLKLHVLIDKYNYCLKKIFRQLIENAGDYSTYMSCIASYSRGNSYIDISSNKKRMTKGEHHSRYSHIKSIDVLLGKLKSWSRAFHLDVDFVSKRPDIRMNFDSAIAPTESKLYTFISEEMCDVELNNSGILIQSPFNFADRLEIVREELYDDKRN